jgi:hypothetical protein
MKVFQVSSLITIQLYYEQLVTTTTAGPILQFWHRGCPPQLSPSTAPSHPSLQERSEWQWGEVRGGRRRGIVRYGAGLLAGALSMVKPHAWGNLDLDLAGAARRQWRVRTGGAVGRCGHGKKQAMALVGEDRLGDRVRWWRWL